MSRGDFPGWQEPHPQPFAGLGEDLEPTELEFEEPQIQLAEARTLPPWLTTEILPGRLIPIWLQTMETP